MEGYVIGSTTATGTISGSLWTTSPDSAGAADQAYTSAANLITLSTGTGVGGCDVGVDSAVTGTNFWLDDVALSDAGPLGPSGSAGTTATAGLPTATGAPPAVNDQVTLNMTIQGA